jgi:hypothetical protein
MNLTQKEIEFLKIVFKNAELNCGAKNLNELLDDNYSYFSTKDILEHSNFTEHQIAGLISSLLSKEIIAITDKDLFCLNLHDASIKILTELGF